MDEKSVIIYLTGKPGTGKYTISKSLSQYGFTICDNHLINNPVFSLLKQDSEAPIPRIAWNAISNIRNAVLEFIADYKDNNYIFTNNLYENDMDRHIYSQIRKLADKKNAIFIPVRLLITEEEHLKRITQPERQARWKSTDPAEVFDQTPLLKIDHPNLLVLDVSELSPEIAAGHVLEHIQKLTHET